MTHEMVDGHTVEILYKQGKPSGQALIEHLLNH
jgi:hypothetical protein